MGGRRNNRDRQNPRTVTIVRRQQSLIHRRSEHWTLLRRRPIGAPGNLPLFCFRLALSSERFCLPLFIFTGGLDNVLANKTGE
jgi:hypothetical protein